MIPQTGGITLGTPQSVSPALIPPAPMAKTAILPASVMDVKPQSAIQGLNWTQIPGAATYAAAAPDGSLWVLSTQPSGADKYIWHYVNGSWTNISGLASRLSVAPNGTLYAINSGGGTYSYSGGTWTALGGGCSDITAASDGSIYVLSNGGSGSDKAIWHNVGGTWSQVPGSGTRIAASWDTKSYTFSSGTVAANGLYILNSIGSIYYENADISFVHLPGNASAVAPTTIGGIFVLGYPTNANGNSIYFYDLDTPGWSTQSGAGVSISSSSAGELYVIGASGGIYSAAITPIPTSTPTPPNAAQGFLAFPLACGDPCGNVPYSQGAYTKSIMNSVLDHSMVKNLDVVGQPYQYGVCLAGSYPNCTDGKGNPAGGNGKIVAFDGETADGTPNPNDRTCIGETIGQPISLSGMVIQGVCGQGYASYDEHPGYDYRAAMGTPVKAAAAGVVVNNVNNGGTMCVPTNISSCAKFGYVGIDHGNGYISQYGHLSLSTISVTPGQPVAQGQQIGLSGWTGLNSQNDAHLHFEVIKRIPGHANNYDAANYAVVDPYGWSGSGTDPLYSVSLGIAPVNLWQSGAPPTIPTNASPGSVSAPGPTQSSSSVGLSWSAVSEATYYSVGVRNMTTDVLVVNTTTTGTSYMASLSADGQYRWNVAACNTAGCSAFTTQLYFQTPTAVASAPTISSVSPNPVTGSNSRQTITINGTGFVNQPTVTLTWTGQPNYTVPAAQVTFVSSTQLQMAITTTTAADNWTVKVTNPDGQSSNTVGFTVVAP